MAQSTVLHADDFGMNMAVNAGILDAFEHGLLTSTAVMANAPAAVAGLAAFNRLSAQYTSGKLAVPLRAGLDDVRRPWDLGVHLNLTQGRPLTGERFPPQLLDAEGRFPGIFRLFARLTRGGEKYAAAIRAELGAQIAFVKEQGLQPTHVNGHQYIELIPAVSAVLPTVMSHFGIPVLRVAIEPSLVASTLAPVPRPAALLLSLVKRRYAQRLRVSLVGRPIVSPRRFFGTAHAGCVDARVVSTFLARAQGAGMTEIAFHPGRAADHAANCSATEGWADPLAALRPRELALLTSADFASQLQRSGVRLVRLSQLYSFGAQPTSAGRQSWIFLKRAA